MNNLNEKILAALDKQDKKVLIKIIQKQAISIVFSGPQLLDPENLSLQIDSQILAAFSAAHFDVNGELPSESMLKEFIDES